MKELLKNKQFLLLNFGQFVSLLGTEMQSFALALYVLNITGSGTKYASVLAVTIIPQIIFGPVLSVLADSLDKRKIIVSLDILSGIVIFFLWRISLSNGISIPIIYVVVIILSIISSLFNPTMSTVLPLLVKKEEIVEANSINSFLVSSGCVIAPLLAGVLLDVFDISAILLINSISFILSACSEIFLKIPSGGKEKFEFSVKKYKADFVEGLRCIRSIKLLKYIVISSCIINLVNNPVLSIGLPYVAKSILGMTDGQYGTMGSIITAASFISPAVITALSKKVPLEKIFIKSLGVFAIVAVLFIINSSNVFLSLFDEGSIIPILFLVLNASITIFVIYMVNIAIASMKQKSISVDILGRVNGIQSSISISMIPVGQMLYGVLFDNVPCFVPFLITAIVLIILSTILNSRLNSNSLDEKIEYTNC